MSGRSVISSQKRCRNSSAHQALTRPASLSRYALAGSARRTRGGVAETSTAPGSSEQDRADEGAAVTERGNADLDLALRQQSLGGVLYPLERHLLAIGRTTGRDEDAVVPQVEDGVRAASSGRDLLPDQGLKKLAHVHVGSHTPIIRCGGRKSRSSGRRSGRTDT